MPVFRCHYKNIQTNKQTNKQTNFGVRCLHNYYKCTGVFVAYYYFGICAGIHGAPVIELSGRGTYEPDFSLAGRAVQTMSAVRDAERREMESVGVPAMKRGALLFLCPTNYRKNAIRHLHDFII